MGIAQAFGMRQLGLQHPAKVDKANRALLAGIGKQRAIRRCIWRPIGRWRRFGIIELSSFSSASWFIPRFPFTLHRECLASVGTIWDWDFQHLSVRARC